MSAEGEQIQQEFGAFRSTGAAVNPIVWLR